MFKGILKPYQPEAVDKMVTRKKMLVAYEMGLGKTCMTIAAIEKLREQGEIEGTWKDLYDYCSTREVKRKWRIK